MLRILTLSVFSCAALLAGCGMGGDARPTPAASPTPDLTNYRSLTDEELLSVTLSLEEFGPRYAIFAPTPSSGPQVLATRSEQTCDPARQGNALGRHRWERAYARFWGSPDPNLPETIVVGTNVDVFATKNSAMEYLNYDAANIQDDARSFEGCFPFAVEGVDRLVVNGLGEQSWGARERISYMGLKGSVSFVSFRRGHLVGTVWLIRLNSEDSTEELMNLARVMDGRMAPFLSTPLSKTNSIVPAAGTIP